MIASTLIPLAICWDALAFAASPAPVAVAAQEQSAAEAVLDTTSQSESLAPNDILSAIDKRMSETKTARGGFIQTDSDGLITTGDFFINRPGRVRFEYNDPTPYLIVSDGTTIAIEDRELHSVDRAPLGSTPMKHFLKESLSLASDSTVLDVRALPDSYMVVLEDKPGKGEEAMEGMLFLKFSKKNFDLTGWTTVDGLGNETRVSLIDLELNKSLSPRLFVLEDEDDRDRD